MTLTVLQRRFAQALLSAPSATEAARIAGYSENGVAQAASRLLRSAKVVAEIEHQRSAARAIVGVEDSTVVRKFADPLEFLTAVAHDPGITLPLRIRAAAAALPYLHVARPAGGTR